MTFELVSIAITPIPILRRIERSYFGRNSNFFSLSEKRDDMFPKGNWAAERRALEEI